ncbi:MAG TPA: hypothetical protein VFQ72_02805 [Candidatus Paceibacterota bacterium]|nr:hypothetical protein [Candidatus Paceibacterota bacterium]
MNSADKDIKKRVLFLTDLKNGDSEEDEYLIGLLRKSFDVVVSHPLECLELLGSVDGVVIRNIWPTYRYIREWTALKEKMSNLSIPTFNSLTGKGDNNGKDYLVDLTRKGFPVIPSVDSLEDIDSLPSTRFYWIKPKEGADGYGAKKLKKEDLRDEDLKDFIIQPYVEFLEEPSFFFIDGKFSYAIVASNRLSQSSVLPYSPTERDLVFAEKFVEWNALPHGIQRIDALRTKTGELLLTEVEDIAPFLYLFDLEETAMKKISDDLIASIRSIF